MFNLKRKIKTDLAESTTRRRAVRMPVEDASFERIFRRNRTLTGSLASSVKSSNELNAELKSSRVQAHDLRRHRRRLSSILLLAIIFASGLFVLIYNFTATPKVYISQAAVSSLTTEYEAAIQQYYGSRPIERINFLLDHGALARYVQAKLPEVASVTSTGAMGIGVTNFDIAVRQPLVAWTINSKKQYVDASGAVFTKNYFKEPAIEVSDESGASTRDGRAIVSNRFLTFIGQSIGAFAHQGLSVEHVIIPADTTREVRVRIAGFDFPIKLSVDRGIGEQAEDVTRVLKHLQVKSQSVQYLDVRVGGRAFYR